MEGHEPVPRSTVQERRTQKRSPNSLHIRYTQDDSSRINRGTLVDLNQNGAGIHTDLPLLVGSRLILEVTSPGGGTARCAGEVLHSRRDTDQSYRAGVRFIDLAEKDQDAIGQILQLDVPGGKEVYQEEDPAEEDPFKGLPSGLERRRATRVAVNRSISYKIFGARGRVREEGVAQLFDLSLNGVGLRTSGPIVQGVSLQLEVVYSGGLRCAIEAECIYCRKEGQENYINGLRFTAVERSDLAFFSKLLAG